MASFCKYCGKVLQDGEICSCPQAQAEAAQQYQGQPPQEGYQQPPQGGYQQPPQGGYQQPPQGGYQQPPQGGYQQPPQGGYQQPPQGDYQQLPQGGYQQPPQQPQQPASPNPFVLALKKLLPYVQSYVKAPVSAAQEVLGQNDMIFACILLGIQAIVVALGLFSLLASICNTLGELITGLMGLGGLGGMGGLGGLAALAGVSIGPSIPMTLIFGILAAAAAIIIHVAMVFVITKILGVNRSFPEALVICGAHSPFVTVLLLAAFILNFLYLPLAMIFFLAAMLAWIVLSVLSLQTLAPAAGQGKFWISSIVGVLAALLIGGWASWFLGSQSVGYITISAAGQSITINDAMKAAGSSLGDIFEDMLEDLF